MKWNPYFNAACAAIYIGAVITLIHYIESSRHDTPDTLIDGLGFLSLLVLSVATMAFLFFFRPLTLLLEGYHREAVLFFLKTLGTFAIVTVTILVLVNMQ